MGVLGLDKNVVITDGCALIVAKEDLSAGLSTIEEGWDEITEVGIVLDEAATESDDETFAENLLIEASCDIVSVCNFGNDVGGVIVDAEDCDVIMPCKGSGWDSCVVSSDDTVVNVDIVGIWVLKE